MRSLLIVFFAGILLTGCGSVYTSPSVNDGKTDAGVYVDVVPLTFSSADFANRMMPYQPRPLPASLQIVGPPRIENSNASLAPATAAQKRQGLRARWPDPLPVQSYRLGVGDNLLFSPPSGAGTAVPGLSQSTLLAASAARYRYTVQDDGSISIPDIGRIRVEGMTLPQIEQAIFQALLERQKEPSFSVEIAEFNSQRVDVGGQVLQPESLPITLAPLSLRAALSAVGGVAEMPNIEDAVVYFYRDGEEYRMLLSDVYANAAGGGQILKDGDAIYVGTLFDEKRAGEYRKEQISLLQLENQFRQSDRSAVSDQIKMGAYPQDHVYVVGEIKKPVRIELPFEQKAKLADILFSPETGGFDFRTANLSQIYVLRHSELSGRVNAYHLDARNVASLVVASELEMRPNDFVFIAEQPITAWNRVIQQLVPSVFFGVVNLAQD